MKNTKIQKILRQVRDGSIPVDEAELMIKQMPFIDLGFAKVDTQREIRQGTGEVIYGASKSSGQIIEIAGSLMENKVKRVLVTRCDEDKATAITERFDNVRYNKDSGLVIIGGMPSCETIGYVLVMTGGTSDIPVAEEAALTSEFLGNRTERVYDVGVAGLHRLLSYTDKIMNASVIIAIAGMEGALASVVGGLADCPVIAVPTSVGYGASFDGLSALLSMLNSCASGVSVVNIDNGFGAGYQASMINHRTDMAEESDNLGRDVWIRR